MKVYDEYAKFDDDAEDEESIPADPIINFDEEDVIGVLSFNMEKSEAIVLIKKLFSMPEDFKSFKDIEKQLSTFREYNYLTRDNIKEILNFAIEQELIKFQCDQYMRID